MKVEIVERCPCGAEFRFEARCVFGVEAPELASWITDFRNRHREHADRVSVVETTRAAKR